MDGERSSFVRRWWLLLALGAVAILLAAAKLSVRSVATGEPLLPGVAGAPVLGPAVTATVLPGPTRVRVRVQVLDRAGQPVPQALIEIRDRFNAIAGTQETGVAGEAILAVPQGSGYVITARKQGFVQGRVEDVDASRPTVLPPPTPAAGAQSGRTFTILQGPTVQVRLGDGDAVASTSPARLLVGHTQARLSLLDASSNLLLKHSEPLGRGRPTYMAQSHEPNRLFAAWSGSPELLVVNATDLTVERTVALNAGGITSFAVDPKTGRLWVSTTAPETPDASLLHEMDPTGQQVLRRLPLSQLASGLRFRSDGSLLYAPSRSANSLLVIDPAAASVLRSIRLGQSPTDLALAPNGQTLFVVNLGSERLLEVDAASGDLVRAIEIGTGATGVVVHPDGRRAFIVNQLLGYVQVVDLGEGRVVDLIPVGRAPQGAALTGDSGGLYVANSGSGTVSIVDLETRAVRETLNIGGQPSSVLLMPTA